jgi:hypothetical protein
MGSHSHRTCHSYPNRPIPDRTGALLITASVAGETFLFGGAAVAMIGLIVVFTAWSRARLAKAGYRR